VKREALDAIAAMVHLRRRGVSVVKAKRAIEAMIDHGSAVLLVPELDGMATLARDLGPFGVEAGPRRTEPVNVADIRRQLQLSQEEFALRFNLDLATLRGWEQGRRTPDLAARNYLKVIAHAPDVAAAASGR
jgi:putative transcriptional regulator